MTARTDLHLLCVWVVLYEDIAWFEISMNNVLFPECLHALGWIKQKTEINGKYMTLCLHNPR